MRYKILGLLFLVVVITSACMGVEAGEGKEERLPISAEPVIVPYINKNIKDVIGTINSESNESGENGSNSAFIEELEEIPVEEENAVKIENITNEGNENDEEENRDSRNAEDFKENGTEGVGGEIETDRNDGLGSYDQPELDGGEYEGNEQDFERNEEPEETGLIYLGEWTTTAYCPCEICCGQWATGCTASGVLATSNHTVACGILPFGTEIMIDGVVYTVEDTGVDGEWIDIFFDSHEQALAYGMQIKSVYLVEG